MSAPGCPLLRLAGGFGAKPPLVNDGFDRSESVVQAGGVAHLLSQHERWLNLRNTRSRPTCLYSVRALLGCLLPSDR